MGDDGVLCTDFKVACDICYCNMIGEPVAIRDVIDRIKDVVHRDDVISSVRSLINWDVVRVDVTNNNNLLYISKRACPIVSDLCRRYWMPVILERN